MNQSNLNPHKLNPSGLPPDGTTDAPPTSALPPDFDVCELDYDLPEELIAQRPPEKRGSSRLLVVDRASQTVVDATVEDLPNHLQGGDTLVMNNTRVVPAKFRLRRASGGAIDALFLNEPQPGVWEALLKGAQRVCEGETLTIDNASDDSSQSAGGEPLTMIAQKRGERGRWQLKFAGASLPNEKPQSAFDILTKVGRMPLPPYIKRTKGTDDRDSDDQQRYQTIYADPPGAVAAPTAGLHFTPAIFDKLRDANISRTFVTLHVGYGTFAPLEVDNLANHQMHEEYFQIDRDTCNHLSQTRDEGGRVVAVGTTSARVLESAWQANRHNEPAQGMTGIFCYPPYEFGGFDALMTNFHLPKSTLMAMVMAFGGVDLIRRAYRHAIERKYRFFSYGDAMLIV